VGGILSEIDYRAMIDGLPDAVMAIDAGHCIVYANAAAGRVLGCEAPELIGQPLATIIPPRLHTPKSGGFGSVLDAGPSQLPGKLISTPFLRRDGREILIDLSLSAIRVGDGDLFVATMRERRGQLHRDGHASRARWLRETTDAASRLGSRPGMDGVLETVVTTLNGDFEAALARVWRFDGAAARLRLRAEGGPARPSPEPSPLEIDAESADSEVAEAARLGVPAIVEDPAGDARLDGDWVGRERIRWGAA